MGEVAKHADAESLWTVLYGKVYDLTEFLPDHPGGAKQVLKYAGKDATRVFDPLHSRAILDTMLPAEKCLGLLEGGGEKLVAVEEKEKPAKPALHEMLNLFDFERVAKGQMTPEGWAYYSSGADDEITLRENHSAYQRIWLRPRILIDVEKIDMSATILGTKASFPLYITATALGKLAHPEGEAVLTRAAHTEGIAQMIPTLGSRSLKELTDEARDAQPQFFQLYVNKDRAITQKLVEQAEASGCKALFITVDAPQLGSREKDKRFKFPEADDTDVQKSKGDGIDRSQGAARAISSFIDPSLKWADLEWFKTITKMPLLLKGVQCAEDAVLAYQAGMNGVVLSNHGGRQLDYSRSAVEVLCEVMPALRAVNADLSKFEVYVDGGIRRGTDIFKAIALGARGVGIGRPTLYGMAAYGQEGAERVIQLLKEELEMCMRLMGTPTLAHITPNHVLTRNISDHFAVQGTDHLAASSYEPLQLAKL
jgi:L-lactate dehydrogenase (cytochrome)